MRLKVDNKYRKVLERVEEKLNELNDCPLYDKGAKNIPSKSGVYLLVENNHAIYIGRSRNIRKRIQAHSRNSSTHYSASFAYILAIKRAKKQNIPLGKRNENCQNEKFSEIFKKCRERVGKKKVKFVLVPNNAEQAVFEVCAALAFRTKYNDFKTH